ncbi:MAG TPA: hypothetical protein VNX01_11610 [Bacteroidia bacterium]|jgi:hypothetical protein|nr:hypothetical protein [Bacteroidia bacterium]
MVTKNMYLNRLIKLSGHLSQSKIQNRLLRHKHYRVNSSMASIECFSSALEDLPVLFKQWEYNADGNPRLNSYEGLNTLTAVAIFFKLDFDSLSHLFVPDFQEPMIYGGKTLPDDAKLNDLAHNIYEYVSVMNNEEEVKEKQKVKIKKLKNKQYEKGDHSNILHKMRA